MKRLILTLITFTLISLSMSFGQSNKELMTALGSGDIESLRSYVDETVEICLFDDHNIYDKEEGLSMIKKFFEDNTPQGFSRKHDGDNHSKSSSYVIGSLSTVTGSYRLFVYTDVIDDKLILEEIRISKKDF